MLAVVGVVSIDLLLSAAVVALGVFLGFWSAGDGAGVTFLRIRFSLTSVCPRLPPPPFPPAMSLSVSHGLQQRGPHFFLCSDFCKPFVVESKRHTNRTLLNRIQSMEAVFTKGARGSGGARRPEFKFGAVWEYTPGNRHIHIYSKVSCRYLLSFCRRGRRCRRRRDKLLACVLIYVCSSSAE